MGSLLIIAISFIFLLANTVSFFIVVIKMITFRFYPVLLSCIDNGKNRGIVKQNMFFGES